MTKEITKAYILQEIQDKFKLREDVPERFLFSEVVVPTYDVGPHLMTEEVMHATKVVNSGPTGYVCFTVPQSERWHLHRYNVIFMTGSFKVAGVMVYRPSVTEYIYLDLTKNQTVSYGYNLPQDVILHSGDQLQMYVDDYTSSGNLQLRIDVTVEEIR